MEIVKNVGTYFGSTEFFDGVLSAKAKIPFTQGEANLFVKVLSAIEEQCKKEGIQKADLGEANVIISDDGSYAFEIGIDDENTYGYYMKNIIYPMNKLREKDNPVFTMIVFTEELAHFVWPRLREQQIKYKIIEILQPIIPEVNEKLLEAFGISMEDY